VLPRALLRAVPAALALAAVTACGDANHIEGRVDWRSADDAIAMQYLAPPWEVEREDDDELHLRIAAEVFGTALEGSPPTHVFGIGPVDPDAGLVAWLPAELVPAGGSGTEGLPSFDTEGLPDPTALEESGGTVGDEQRDTLEHLADVDLADPRAVALAELNYLVDAEDADLIAALAVDDRGAWTYEVVVAPGVFVRNFYLPSSKGTVRVLFASLFDLDVDDIEVMRATIRTDGVVTR
jgi:hypothetical protein